MSPGEEWERDIDWKRKHIARVQNLTWSSDEAPSQDVRQKIEPWLSALFQAEHLNLLVGNGLTTAVATAADVTAPNMGAGVDSRPYGPAIDAIAENLGKRSGRGQANVEDRIRAIGDFTSGLRILVEGGDPALGDEEHKASYLVSEWQDALEEILKSLLREVLSTERGIAEVALNLQKPERANEVRRAIGGFILPFASRTATRDRLHIFTTNYDRLVEYGCELLGLHIIDRFVGQLEPVFRSSRLSLDYHYDPPGIRGEPRYLEGVVRLTKLHGSIDWRARPGPAGSTQVIRCAFPFGAPEDYPEAANATTDSLLVYPNPAKDVETLEFPYAELFRDFASAICRPNAVLVTYGYGFGDDHINRILWDMLQIPSTHLVIISYGQKRRVYDFCSKAARPEQITILLGEHFGDMATLVENYLPAPAIDRTTWRMVDILSRRAAPHEATAAGEASGNSAEGGPL